MKTPLSSILSACAIFGMAASVSAAEFEFSGSMASSPPDFYSSMQMDGYVKVTYTGTDDDTWDLGAASLGLRNYSYDVNGAFEMNLSGGKIYSQYGGPISLIHFGEGFTSKTKIINSSNLQGGGGNIIRANILTFENNGTIQSASSSSSETLYIECGFGNTGGGFVFKNTGDIISDGPRSALKIVRAGNSTIDISAGTISSRSNAIEIGSVASGYMNIGSGVTLSGNINIGDGGLDVSIAEGALITGRITIGGGNTLTIDGGLDLGNVSGIIMNAGSTLIVDNWDGGDIFGNVYMDVSQADVEMKVADGAFEDADIGTVYTIMSGGSYNDGDFCGYSDGDIYMDGIYEFVVSYANGNVSLELAGIIPEPAAFAAVFGALSLALALRRRRG